MATRKTNQVQAEQPAQGQDQKNTQLEQDADKVEQTGQDQPERDMFADIPNPCVYCGPSVRGVARQYTTYMGGIPAELKEFVKAHPAARRLIVSTAKFASVRKRLETPGTAESTIYKKVKAEL